MSSKRTPAGISSILTKKASAPPSKADSVAPSNVNVAAPSKAATSASSKVSKAATSAPSKAATSAPSKVSKTVSSKVDAEKEMLAQKKERDDLRAVQQAKIMEKRTALEAAQVSSVPEDFVSVFDVPGFMAIGAVNADGVNIGGVYGMYFLPGQDQDGFEMSKDDGFGSTSHIKFGLYEFQLDYEYSDDDPTILKNNIYVDCTKINWKLQSDSRVGKLFHAADAYYVYCFDDADEGGTNEYGEVDIATTLAGIYAGTVGGDQWSAEIDTSGLFRVIAKDVWLGESVVSLVPAYGEWFTTNSADNAAPIATGNPINLPTSPVDCNTIFVTQSASKFKFVKAGLYDFGWILHTDAVNPISVSIRLEAGSIYSDATIGQLHAPQGAIGRALIRVDDDDTEISLVNSGVTAWSINYTAVDGGPISKSGVVIRRVDMTDF